VILPSRRALLLLAGASTLGLAGYVWPGAADALVAANALWVLLVAIDARRAADPRRLEVSRAAQPSYSLGRRGEVRYRWTNQSARPARLEVRETRPQILGGTQPRHALSISPTSSTVLELPVDPLRRGRETAGEIAARSLGPWGLAVRQWRQALPWTVTVYPQLPSDRLRRAIAEATRNRTAGQAAVRRLGEGRMFESLRDWVPGDDTRHIDWKATARRRKPIARQYEEERRQHVLLVLDAGRLLTEEVAGAPRMDHVVRAALGLAFAAFHHDDNVGVMVFADRVDHYVAPQRGRRGLEQVLDVLAVTEPRLVEPDYPGALRYLAVRNRKRALTVFFTDVIDALASEALVAHVGSLRPRHLPLLVTLRNPELDALASLRPEDSLQAYRKAAAEELLGARDEALARMRRSGCLVLDVPAVRAGTAVVEKYVELKRRGRL